MNSISRGQFIGRCGQWVVRVDKREEPNDNPGASRNHLVKGGFHAPGIDVRRGRCMISSASPHPLVREETAPIYVDALRKVMWFGRPVEIARPKRRLIVFLLKALCEDADHASVSTGSSHSVNVISAGRLPSSLFRPPTD
jgi:hypothetical protein